MTHHICPFLYSFRIISRYLLRFSLVSSDVQSLFCFPRSSHFRSFDSNFCAFEISCLTASTYQRILDYRFWPHIHPVIDCRVLFENILDSLDYVIDLHHRISGLCSFHVQKPTEQHRFSLSKQFIICHLRPLGHFFRELTDTLSPLKVFISVTSRIIPLHS